MKVGHRPAGRPDGQPVIQTGLETGALILNAPGKKPDQDDGEAKIRDASRALRGFLAMLNAHGASSTSQAYGHS